MGTDAPRKGEVVSIEEYASATLAEFDHALATAAQLRDHLALRVHALRMASDERVASASAEYEERAAESRPYEDAIPVEDLIAEAKSR